MSRNAAAFAQTFAELTGLEEQFQALTLPSRATGLRISKDLGTKPTNIGFVPISTHLDMKKEPSKEDVYATTNTGDVAYLRDALGLHC